MARFAMEFPYQSLEIFIEIKKIGMEIPMQNPHFSSFLIIKVEIIIVLKSCQC